MKKLLLMAFLVFVSSRTFAIDQERAVNAIIGEAENDQMLPLACSLVNRGTLKGVYGERSKRVLKRLYNAKTYDKAAKAWKEAQTPSNCQMVQGAGHWQSVSDMAKSQTWRDQCQMTYKTDKTTYFKCGGY